MPRVNGWVGALLALLLACLAQTAFAQASQPSFPKFTGLVVDDAEVLPDDVERDLTAKLQALQRDTKRQLVVATIRDTQGYPLEDYGYRLGRAWAVGLNDVNNGVILFLAPNNPKGQRGPRIEVGYGLEPVLTDALSSQIINEKMMPPLRDSNDISAALEAGTDALIGQLRAAPEEQKARTDAAAAAFDKTHRRSTGAEGGVPVALIFWLVVIAFVVLPALVRRRHHGRWGRRYGGSNWPIVLWSIGNEIGRASSRGGSWSGGGWGDGSSSSGGGGGGGWTGGGFTGGGGGSFGGGGASGSW